MVGRSCRDKRDASCEPCTDRVCVSDGAWVKHGACLIHRQGTGGPDGLRGDRVGVGDVGQVSWWTWSVWHSPRGDDSWGAGSKQHARMVGRSCGDKRDASRQPCCDRVGVIDGAWVKHGACLVHRQGTRGSDGLRGDRLGVGDIGQVSGWTWHARHSTSGDDSRGARWQRQPRMVGGRGWSELDTPG